MQLPSEGFIIEREVNGTFTVSGVLEKMEYWRMGPFKTRDEARAYIRRVKQERSDRLNELRREDEYELSEMRSE